MDLTKSQRAEVRKLSGRIERIEMSRALMKAGKPQEALEILLKLRAAYNDPHKVKYVETMIEAAEEAIRQIKKKSGWFRRV